MNCIYGVVCFHTSVGHTQHKDRPRRRRFPYIAAVWRLLVELIALFGLFRELAISTRTGASCGHPILTTRTGRLVWSRQVISATLLHNLWPDRL